MVASQKILPGEVVIVDTAYTTSLFPPFYPTHCNACFTRLQCPESALPCPTCSKVNNAGVSLFHNDDHIILSRI